MAASAAGDEETGKLLAALYHKATKSEANPKPLVRHTLHHVADEAHPGKRFDITSWKTVEFAYRKADSVGVDKDLPTLARGLFTLALPNDDDDGNQPESSADAVQRERQRILVRGYDKFFNVGEMAWTKPASIERYSSPPYILSFKENGCIIFIAALSPTQLVVTSKHALESLKADETEDDVAGEQTAHPARQSVSHAAKGEEWVEKHLARVGKTKADLAAELWERGETAVAELCDDSFEEHVLAYPPEKSGLHLHGLNSNTVNFQTRPMSDVDDFARQWGFIPTRYLTMQSMEEVNAFTDRIGTTGEWEGEAIEGFVVRTTMPQEPPQSDPWAGHVSPPYSPGQTWFYKVKFDEPYLMYRDWRELAKKMLVERDKWQDKLSKGVDGEGAGESGTNGKSEEAAASSESVGAGVEAGVDNLDIESNAATDGAKKSKKQLKREHKEAVKHLAKAQGVARSANGAPDPPQAPKSRSDRPETKLFIRWCYDRVYGSADGSVKSQPNLFSGIQSGKGIIRLRDTFLAYLETEEGKARLKELGGARGALAAKLNLGEASTSAAAAPLAPSPDAHRPYTHLLILPIAVPGCGKTSLFHSLSHLYPTHLTHTQSDDVPTKKSGPTFLKNICAELGKRRVVLADRNNHLLQHRDEIVEAVRGWEERGGRTEEEVRGERKRRHQMERAGKAAVESASNTSTGPRPRVKFLALVYTLDLLSLNALHRLLADRILLRGSNHQSLVADVTSASGCRTHEKILWRFLEAYEPFGSAEGKGEGDKGRGDAQMDVVVNLGVELDVREQLERVLECWGQEGVLPESEGALLEQVKGTTPAQLAEAVEAAKAYKATPLKKAAAKEASVPVAKPRYYGIAVEMDIAQFLAPLLAQTEGQDEASSARTQRARQLLDDLSSGRRVVQRPHITLVHNSNTRQPEEGQTDDLTSLPESERLEILAARRRWARYSSLCAASESTGVDFDISFDRLCWEGQRVMTLSVSSVKPRASSIAKLSYEEMMELQGREWRAHVTVGTCSEEVRPYEANRVAREVDALVDAGEREGGKEGEEKIEWIELPLSREGEAPKVQGRLVGMS